MKKLEVKPETSKTSKEVLPKEVNAIVDKLTNKTEKSCLNCKLFSKCNDPLKSFAYVCDKHTFVPTYDSDKLVKPAKFSAPMILLPIAKDFAESDDEYNLQGIIDKVFTEGMLVPPDLSIDDRDLPQAENFFQFVTDPRFVDVNDFRPFAKQLQIGINLFSEYCPNCSKPGYVEDIPLHATADQINENVVHLKWGVCPKCKAQKSQLIQDGLLKPYSEFAGLAGQRSGKTMSISLLACYNLHRHLKTNPNKVYKLPKSQPLTATYAALNFDQAKANLWTPIYNFITSSPWFGELHKLLDDVGRKRGEELYRIKDTYYQYRYKNITANPSGPNKRTMRGSSRWDACLTGDSLVSTNLGLLRIDDKKIVDAVTHKGTSNRNITNQIYTGKKECFAVKLKNGMKIKATDNHRFLVYAGKGTTKWKRVEHLNEKDYVAISLGGNFPNELLFDYKANKVPELSRGKVAALAMLELGKFTLDQIIQKVGELKGITALTSRLKKSGAIHVKRNYRAPADYTVIDQDSLQKFVDYKGKITKNRHSVVFPEKMTPELASIIGYLISDGDYAQNGYEIDFCTTSRRKLKHFIECFVTCFGINPRTSTWKTKLNTTAYKAVFALKELREFIIYIGLTPAVSNTKRIPWSILQANRECTVAMVNAMLSSDGGKYGRGYYYYSKSKKLLQDLQLVLLRLGYPTKILEDRLLFNSWTFNEFLKQDYNGFRKRNGDKALKVVDIDLDFKSKSNNNRLWDEYRIPNSMYKDGNTNSYLHTKDIFNRKPYTSSLVNSGLIFSRVAKIKAIGIRKVYDITVDHKDHTFTANGFAAHNSIDEIGWFTVMEKGKTAEKMDADEVYTAISRSFKTLRAAYSRLIEDGQNNVPSPMFYNISSPSSRRDMITKLWKQSRNSNQIYGLRAATWEFNPTITRKDLQVDFDLDYNKAMRDFGAKPASSGSPFISNEKHIVGLYDDYRNGAAIKTWREASPSGRLQTLAKIDFADKGYMTQGKARSVLSLDAGFCVSEDTMITTENGIFEIKNLAVGKKKEFVPIDLNIMGSSGKAKADYWVNSGIKDLLEITTSNGRTLKVTPDHQVQTMKNNTFVWVKAKNLKPSDVLCLSTKKLVRKNKLKLNLSKQLKTCREGSLLGKHKKTIKHPIYMDPDLAYLIGSIVAEGNFNEYSIHIGNVNIKFLKNLERILWEKFGLVCTWNKKYTKGDSYTIYGVSGNCNHDFWQLSCFSVALCSWLVELGLCATGNYGLKASYYKVVPWSILQADEQSQLAFLAAYAECDGRLVADRYEMTIWSKSIKLLDQLQALLTAHGISTNRWEDYISTSSSFYFYKLYSAFKKYLLFKDMKWKPPHRSSAREGVSASYIKDFIKTRRSRANGAKRGGGVWYWNDDGKEILLNIDEVDNIRLPAAKLLYTRKKYDLFLKSLKKISKIEYQKLVSLLKLEYQYTTLKSIKSIGKGQVYDLSMSDKSEPAFSANGIIVHNSNNSFAVVIANINPIEGYAQYPFVGEIIPIKDYPLDFNNIYSEVLWPLVKHYNVCVAVTDRWQGKKFMADLEADAAKEFSYPLIPVEYSVKYQDFEEFRQAIYDSAISLPQLEMSAKKAMDLADMDSGKKYPECYRDYPLSHLFFQFLTVQDHSGSSVEKGDNGGTDDIFRAMVLAHKILTTPDFHDILIGEGFQLLQKPMAAYASGASNAGGAMTGFRHGAFSSPSNINRPRDLSGGPSAVGSTGSNGRIR